MEEKKYRYFIEMGWKGTEFHGWQVQPNAYTIQEEMEKKLSTLLQQDIAVIGAGRTDTGVHASYFVAHFDSIEPLVEPEKLVFKLNNFIHPDIVILSLSAVEPNSHARFDAISRTYQYHIIQNKDPFFRDYAWHHYPPLKVKNMNAGAKLLLKHKDFTSFSRLHSDTKTNFCTIKYAKWEKQNNRLTFTITADRFLRNMVRAIVGTLVEIGQKKIAPEDIENILAKKDRAAAGASAPAKGLFLTDIQYEPTIFKQQNAEFILI